MNDDKKAKLLASQIRSMASVIDTKVCELEALGFNAVVELDAKTGKLELCASKTMQVSL